MSITQPKTLSGTMELLPQDQIAFNRIKNIIIKNYEKYGFLPLDTPIIESAEVLLAKAGGETEKQIYSFAKGDNNICLRFDLTVPLAKYVSLNYNNLTFPFRRYQIGKVYRGERPQKGRFREFYQCDIDIIGKDKLSIKNDAEIPSIIYNIFKELDFGDFTIYLSNRKVVSGLVKELALEDKKMEIFRIIDKYDKIGEENVKQSLLKDFGISEDKVQKLMSFITISGSKQQKIDQLKNLGISSEEYFEGIYELEEVIKYMKDCKVPDNYFDINLTIVRGLDYYTGMVYETFLNEHKNIGSVCSGGRYDNLAGFYTNNKLPGVGISIGLTRLFDQMKSCGLIKAENKSISSVLIIPMQDEFTSKAFEIANLLRENNINTQVFAEDTKFKNKIAYADKLSIPYIMILGEDEIKENKVTLKTMATHEQQTTSLEEALKNIKQ